jgi:hypothetical protein
MKAIDMRQLPQQIKDTKVTLTTLTEGIQATESAEITAVDTRILITTRVAIIAMDARDIITIKTVITVIANTGPGMSPWNWLQELYPRGLSNLSSAT